MTLSEVRDLFVAKYKLECLKRNVREIDISDKMIATLISEAQQDILSKLKVASTYADISITPVTTFTTYNLPTDFGGLKGKPSISGTDLEVVSLSELPTTGTLDTADPTNSRCAIYNDGTRWKIYLVPLANVAKTLRVWYYIATHNYSPSGLTAQDWGSFSGTAFTGNLKIPDDYINAAILYILGQLFDDIIINKYDPEIRRLRGNDFNTVKEETDYNMGGISFD